MPRWLPATEPETIKLVWLAAVNVQVSLVVSKPLAVTTTVAVAAVGTRSDRTYRSDRAGIFRITGHAVP